MVPPLRPLPLKEPVVPPLFSVMVSVSVAAVLGSLIVPPANGCTGASDVVVCPFFFQAEDGIRDKLVSGVEACVFPIWVALALLRSLSVNVVVVLEPGAPAFG